MQMGGGELNEKGRTVWHDYMTNRFMFGKDSGIEQGYEQPGFVPSPTEGFGLNIQYANTSFGQGMSVTPVQMAAAFSATINGGNYFRPTLLDPEAGQAVQPLKAGIIKPEVSDQVRAMHETTVQRNYQFAMHKGYKVGGKTGTAQITKPEGGYYDDKYNGTFIGYVGGDTPDYVIMVKIEDPKVTGFAGRYAAAPMFGKVVEMLVQNYAIPLSSQ